MTNPFADATAYDFKLRYAPTAAIPAAPTPAPAPASNYAGAYQGSPAMSTPAAPAPMAPMTSAELPQRPQGPMGGNPLGFDDWLHQFFKSGDRYHIPSAMRAYQDYVDSFNRANPQMTPYQREMVNIRRDELNARNAPKPQTPLETELDKAMMNALQGMSPDEVQALGGEMLMHKNAGWNKPNAVQERTVGVREAEQRSREAGGDMKPDRLLSSSVQILRLLNSDNAPFDPQTGQLPPEYASLRDGALATIRQYLGNAAADAAGTPQSTAAPTSPGVTPAGGKVKIRILNGPDQGAEAEVERAKLTGYTEGTDYEIIP